MGVDTRVKRRRKTNIKKMEKFRCLQGARNTRPDAELPENSQKNNGASEADGQELDVELLLVAGTSTPKICFFFVTTSIVEVTVKIRGVCVGTTSTCSACVKNTLSYTKAFISRMRKSVLLYLYSKCTFETSLFFNSSNCATIFKLIVCFSLV